MEETPLVSRIPQDEDERNTISISPNLQPVGFLACRACPRCGEQGGTSVLVPPRLSSRARDGEERQDLHGGTREGEQEFVVQWLPSPFCFAELYK